MSDDIDAILSDLEKEADEKAKLDRIWNSLVSPKRRRKPKEGPKRPRGRPVGWRSPKPKAPAPPRKRPEGRKGRMPGETYQKIRREEGDELRRVGIYLLASEIAWLQNQPGGGIGKTIRRLIKEARWEEENQQD